MNKTMDKPLLPPSIIREINQELQELQQDKPKLRKLVTDIIVTKRRNKNLSELEMLDKIYKSRKVEAS